MRFWCFIKVIGTHLGFVAVLFEFADLMALELEGDLADHLKQQVIATAEPQPVDLPESQEDDDEVQINPLLAAEMAKEQARTKQDIQALDVFSTAIHHLSQNYVDASVTDMSQLVHAALRGMAYSLDPHTVFLTKKQFDKLQQSTVGKDVGVGLELSHHTGEHFIRVLSVVKGSPADKSGIRAQDKVVAIDGQKLENLAASDYPSLIRSRGSLIRLTIEQPDQSHKQHRLRYEWIEVEDVFSKVLPPAIGYVQVAVFQEDTAHKVAEFLQTHHQQLGGLILDLRGNSGGLLSEAIAVSNQFIESGLLLSVVGRDAENTERHFALKEDTYSGFPMIVLVDGYSASSSEIVAGALQDHERAIIMGQKTFGKGSVQILMPLPDGSGLKMTVARYYTPSGRSIQAEGIAPDLVLATSEPEQPADEHKQPLKEGDLKGHITSKRLEFDGVMETPPAVRGFDHYIAQWEVEDQQDYSLRMAYIYLKAWLKLDQNLQRRPVKSAPVQSISSSIP